MPNFPVHWLNTLEADHAAYPRAPSTPKGNLNENYSSIGSARPHMGKPLAGLVARFLLETEVLPDQEACCEGAAAPPPQQSES